MHTESAARPVSGFPILMGFFALMSLFMGFFAFIMAAPAVQAADPDFCAHQLGATWPGFSLIPEARVEGQAITAEGKIWVFGGFNENFVPSRTAHMYDPQSNTWTTKASIPLDASAEIGLSHGGIAYDEVTRTIWIAGGLVKYPLVTKKVWKYHIPSNTWSRGPDLPQNRASAPLIKVGRKLYYIGGIGDNRYTDYNNNWVLDLDNPTAWDTSSAAPFPEGRKRNHASGTNIDGKIYLLGGMFGHNGRYAFNDGKEVDIDLIDIYDPATNTWSLMYDENGNEIRLPFVRSHFEPGTSVHNGRIIMVGGRMLPQGYDGPKEISDQSLQDVSEFDPVTGTVTKLGDFPADYRLAPVGQAVNGTLYVSTGDLKSRSSWRNTITLPCTVDPIPYDDTMTVLEGGTATALTTGKNTVLHNDLGRTFPMSVVSFTQPQYGQVVVNADGTFSYDHDDSDTTTDSFTYTVSNTQGTAIGVVIVNITPTNDAPQTPVPTATPTSTATSTATATPTSTVTSTAVPPTATPTSTVTSTAVPPTATATSTASSTATATATSTATTAPNEPTSTPTATYTPGVNEPTLTPTATPTQGANGPTSTPTDDDDDSTPSATPTQGDNGPTSTPTPVDNGPTATPTQSNNGPTSTPTPVDNGPTATPTQSNNGPTSTPTPVDNGPTATPTATATSTPDSALGNPDVTIIIQNGGVVLPTFVWGPTRDANDQPFIADWYNLVVVDDSNAIILNVILTGTDVCTLAQGCQYTPTPEELPLGLLNGAYSWWVQYGLNGITSEWLPAGDFEVNQPEPLPGTGNWVDATTGRMVLMLEHNPSVSWVQVWIGTPTFQTLHQQWYPMTQATCTGMQCALLLDAHLPNGDYTLYMQTWGPGGYNKGDAAYWSGPLDFALDFAPASLVTSLQTDGATFTWAASVGATWYQVWVGTPGPDFNTRYIQWLPATALGCGNGGTCSLTPTMTLENGTFAWYVQAWGPGGITTEGIQGWVAGPQFNH